MAIARADLVNPALARWYHCRGAPGVCAACVPVGRGARLEGKVAIWRELAAIFDRLGTTAESWWSRLGKLNQGRLFGRVLAATCERLQEVANRLGVRRLVNLGRCPAR
jgi:hypothetical protein